MSLFHSLLQAFIPAASAQTLRGAGRGASGISTMWDTICGTIVCDESEGLVGVLTRNVVSFVLGLISVVAVCLVIYAGILMITKGEEGLTEAKKILMYVAVGIILAMISGGAIAFVVYLLQKWFT